MNTEKQPTFKDLSDELRKVDSLAADVFDKWFDNLPAEEKNNSEFFFLVFTVVGGLAAMIEKDVLSETRLGDKIFTYGIEQMLKVDEFTSNTTAVYEVLDKARTEGHRRVSLISEYLNFMEGQIEINIADAPDGIKISHVEAALNLFKETILGTPWCYFMPQITKQLIEVGNKLGISVDN